MSSFVWAFYSFAKEFHQLLIEDLLDRILALPVGGKTLFLLSARPFHCKSPYSHYLLQSKVQSDRKFASRVLTQNFLSSTGLQLWAMLCFTLLRHEMLKKEEGAPWALCGIHVTVPHLKTRGKGSASSRSHHFVIAYSVTIILLGSVHASSHLVAVAILWKRLCDVSFSYISILI